jgi:hypothetical protein
MGGKQLGFGDYEEPTAKKRTRREKVLADMEQMVPEVGAFYWTVLAPDIVNPGREEQSSVSV